MFEDNNKISENPVCTTFEDNANRLTGLIVNAKSNINELVSIVNAIDPSILKDSCFPSPYQTSKTGILAMLDNSISVVESDIDITRSLIITIKSHICLCNQPTQL